MLSLLLPAPEASSPCPSCPSSSPSSSLEVTRDWTPDCCGDDSLALPSESVPPATPLAVVVSSPAVEEGADEGLGPIPVLSTIMGRVRWRRSAGGGSGEDEEDEEAGPPPPPPLSGEWWRWWWAEEDPSTSSTCTEQQSESRLRTTVPVTRYHIRVKVKR
jgi:hypothetical protein